MRSKTLITVLTILLNSNLITSCNKDNNDLFDFSQKDSYSNDNEIILGKEPRNPYFIDSMIVAVKLLADNDINCPIPLANITPTGQYVKVFCPNDSILDLIKDDTSVLWYYYPLNYDIIQPGSYYVGDSLPDTSSCYLYGVVPLNYMFPENIDVKKIYDVFIPDDFDEYLNYEDYFDALEEMSFLHCGYIEENTSDKESQSSQSNPAKYTKWNPSAEIKVIDDLRGIYVPLEGVKVCVRRNCHSDWAITDSFGRCTMKKKFKARVDYSIEWERHYWRIVGRNNQTALITGPFYNNKWTLNINQSNGADLMCATIHRAALIANYKDNWTIKRPRKENFLFTRKLKIRYNDINNPLNTDKIGEAYCKINAGSSNTDVDIWGKDYSGNYFSTTSIFATTLHELAHWSHAFFYGQRSFKRDVNRFIIESWAQCVEWKITTEIYPEYFGSNGYHDGFQDWNASLASEDRFPYTPVFIDMIDNYNQGQYNGTRPYDIISHYSLKEIQDSILPGVNRLNALRDTLYNHKLHGETNTAIDSLLSKYSGTTFF